MQFDWRAKVKETATLRTMGQQFQAAMEAAGLKRTADTGQVNWTTIEYPGVNGTIGYEIYEFTDPLAATKPLLVKFTWRRQSAELIGFFMQAGTASNGTGELTGVTTSARTAGFENTGSFEGTGSGIITFTDDGVLVIAKAPSEVKLQTTNSSNFRVCGVERLRDKDGDIDGDSFVVWGETNNGSDGFDNTMGCQVVEDGVVKTMQRKSSGGSAMPMFIQPTETAVVGSDTFLGVYIPVGLRPHPPLTGVLATAENDFVGGTKGKVHRFGADREYTKVGSDGAEREGFSQIANSLTGIMVLDE